MAETARKTLIQNRKARHDFFVLDDIEAGIALSGTEVKSIRLGQCNLKDSYAQVENGEVFLTGVHISPYEKGSIHNLDPMRRRKLLLHKHEIIKLFQSVKQEGLTLIPLSLYLSKGKVKVQLGICKGKKNYDKRHDLADRDAQRDIERAMHDRRRDRSGE